MNNLLPPGYVIRPPTLDDIPAVTRLIRLYDLQQDGESFISEEEIKGEWEKPGFCLETDAWVITAPDGQGRHLVVGYQEVWNRTDHALIKGDGYVHIEYNGKGIGTTMLRLAEARAREHIPLATEESRVFLRNGVSGSDRAARELHENEGYSPSRFFWTMEIDLDGAPPNPNWPPGIRLREFVRGQDDRKVFNAMEDAFRDHWGYSAWDYEWWCKRIFEIDHFDPNLWFIAVDGDEIAGASLCTYHEEKGWVSQLAVRRPWRRSGLGLALLQHSFGEFYKRGTRKIALGVDASNPTGATRLYKKAGMQVAIENVVFEKELRPGYDPEDQEHAQRQSAEG